MNENQNGGIVIQKKHIVIVAVVIVLLLAGGILVGANWSKWFGPKAEAPQSTAPAAALDIDPNAGNWDGKLPKDEEEEVGIKIPGYPSITIAKESEHVRMALVNPEGNPCYFKFVIVLNDTGEQIFESKYVAPGDAITDVALTRPLEEGEYNATIQITTIALDQVTPLNGANVETVLIAK